MEDRTLLATKSLLSGLPSLTALGTIGNLAVRAGGSISVNAGAASSLVVSGFPSATTAGAAGTITITAKDSSGNIATGYLGTVHFASSDTQATLPANYKFTAADHGMHTFSVTLKTVGNQSVSATDAIAGPISGAQTGITVRAVGSNAWTNPQLITISFVPDGTLVTAGINGKVYSNLFATFNAKYPKAVWQNAILTAAQTWALQANLNFEVVGDNGTTFGQGLYQQGDPGMGDIRIGGYSFGNAFLAGAYQPPPANNYSSAGDINFNTSQNLHIGSTYDIQTVALHELGHALGLGHTTLYSSVMYPYYHGVTRALTSTDIANIQALYGARQPDAYNASPATANRSIWAAASLDALINPSNLTAVVNNLSINSPTQAEYFKFTAPVGTGNTLKITVQSAGLSMFTPSVTVYAANQSTVVAFASSPVQYHGVTVSVPVSGVTAGQQFYVKVSGVDSSAFSTGAYSLTLNFGTRPAPAVSLPYTQVLNGAVLVGGGGLAMAHRLDLLSPSLDLVPPCCLGHVAGCGCPVCRSAVLGPTAAPGPQQPEHAELLLWHALETTPQWMPEERPKQTTSPLDDWTAAQRQMEAVATFDDQANAASSPACCDVCFADQQWVDEVFSALSLDS